MSNRNNLVLGSDSHFADFRYAGRKLPRKLKKRLKRRGWFVGPLRFKTLSSTPTPRYWYPVQDGPFQVQVNKDRKCPICEMEALLSVK